MKTKAIKKIADAVSKKYFMPLPIVENIINKNGDPQVEIRSELTQDEGGSELYRRIEKLDNSYICEYQGGCVYIVYQPK